MTELLIFLLIKHFVFDYVWQLKWMLDQKSSYGAAGGIAHASAHGFGTLACVLFFVSVPLAIIIAVLDTVLHYHIDYAKTIWSKQNHAAPDQNKFWIAHGLDQLAHQLTYVLIAVICFWR